MKRICLLAVVLCAAATMEAHAQSGISGQKRTPEQHAQARQCAKNAGLKIDSRGNWSGNDASPEQRERYMACKSKNNIP
jgi:hypothetical protein